MLAGLMVNRKRLIIGSGKKIYFLCWVTVYIRESPNLNFSKVNYHDKDIPAEGRYTVDPQLTVRPGSIIILGS